SVRHIFKPISYLEIQLLSGVSGGYITVKGGLMRIGIAFPASVFIIAVAFLAWFILGGYATPGT
ncbi:YoaK family small membrane protein, partial [Klebsiella pneumoniae]